MVSTSPEPIAFSGMAALGSKLYITGGCQVRATPPVDHACLRGGSLTGAARQNGDGTIPNDRSDQQQLWVFDTADGSWAVGPPMLRARQECAAVTLGDRVYAFGWHADRSCESIGAGEAGWREEAACPVCRGTLPSLCHPL